MNETILSLPLHLQISLASGYLAYLIAYAGIRQHHTASEVFFRSLAFGMIATAVLLSTAAEGSREPYMRAVVAVIATISVGALWRWRGMRWSRKIFHGSNISWTDDIPTAWLSITATDTDARPSQLSVDLQCGRVLLCEDTRDFKDSPYGPCVFGLDGSIAMYVTAEMRTDGSWLEQKDVRHGDGDRLTFIPASEVRRVDLRFWTKPSVKAGKVEAKGAAVQAEGP